jgi:hypothetical protein
MNSLRIYKNTVELALQSYIKIEVYFIGGIKLDEFKIDYFNFSGLEKMRKGLLKKLNLMQKGFILKGLKKFTILRGGLFHYYIYFSINDFCCVLNIYVLPEAYCRY